MFLSCQLTLGVTCVEEQAGMYNAMCLLEGPRPISAD